MTVRIDSLIREIVLGTKALHRPSVAYCSNHGLLPEVFVRTPAEEMRNLFFLPGSPYKTELNQDLFALLVNRFRPGYFIEIGANDGFTLSNTVYLEEHFEWDGLLVEANPQYLESLSRRKAKSVISAVVENEGDYEFCSAGLYGGLINSLDTKHKARTKDAESITVLGVKLERLLAESNAPKWVNFISIDVEGAEVEIVRQMCSLQTHRFSCGCIEHNAREDDYERIKHLLKTSGYRIVWERQTKHDLFFMHEEVFDGSF